jgi:hypothetical protein
MGLSPEFFFFFAALRANLTFGKTLGPEKSPEHGKVFQEYGWETRTSDQAQNLKHDARRTESFRLRVLAQE